MDALAIQLRHDAHHPWLRRVRVQYNFDYLRKTNPHGCLQRFGYPAWMTHDIPQDLSDNGIGLYHWPIFTDDPR